MSTRGKFNTSVYHGEMGGKAIPNDMQSSVKQLRDEFIVSGADAYVLRVSSVFGMAPLRFKPRGKSYTVSLSNYMVVYSFLLVLVFAAMTVFGKASGLHQGLKTYPYLSSFFYQIVSWADSIMAALMAVVVVYGAPGRIKSMLKINGILTSVDKSIGAQSSHRIERKLWASVVFLIFFFTLMIVNDIVYYCTVPQIKWKLLIHYIGYYLLWFVIMILEAQFAFTATSVRTSFEAVNEALSVIDRHISSLNSDNATCSDTLNMFETTEPRFRNVAIIMRNSVTGEPQLLVPPSDAVHQIASHFDALRNVVDRVTKSYGVSLVVILICNLIHLIVIPYFALLGFKVRDDKYYFMMLESLWVICHVLKLFMVVEPCHYTIVECKKTESLVCRMLLVSPSSGPLLARLELFLRQLMMQPLSFNLVGLCSLDRQLIASIFGAVATYLVILIQFQKNDDLD